MMGIDRGWVHMLKMGEHIWDKTHKEDKEEKEEEST